jgi:CHAT domain-containing protein
MNLSEPKSNQKATIRGTDPFIEYVGPTLSLNFKVKQSFLGRYSRNKISIIFVILLILSMTLLQAARVSKEFMDIDKKWVKLQNENRYFDCISVSEKRFKIFLKELGKCGLSAQACIELAENYGRVGDKDNCIMFANKALEISIQATGRNTELTAAMLSRKGVLHAIFNDRVNAVKDIEESYDIIKKCNPEGDLVPAYLATVASIYAGMNDPIALDKFLIVIEDLERIIKNKNISLNIITFTGEAEKEQNHQKAIMESFIQSNFNLITEYNKYGKHDKALVLSRKMVDMLSALGENEHMPIVASEYLANSLLKCKEFNEAEKLYLKACSFWEDLGGYSANQVASLNGLSEIYFQKKDYAKSLHYANKSYKSNHDFVKNDKLKAENQLIALCHLKCGELNKATQFINDEIFGINKLLSEILQLSEKEKLNIASRILEISPFVKILPPKESYECLVNWKGVVSDAQLQERKLLKNAEISKIYSQITLLKQKLQTIDIINDANSENYKNDLLLTLSKSQREISDLANKNGYRQNPLIDQNYIDNCLPIDSAILDFFVFNDPYNDSDSTYGVFIKAKGEVPKYILVCDLKNMNALIEQFKSAITNNDESKLSDILSQISNIFWKPIKNELSNNINRLFISPEAELNFLPFSTLLDNNGVFVCERYDISLISSSRDLARSPAPFIQKTLALYANPIFDACFDSSTASEFISIRSAEAVTFGSITLPPLPGTEVEAQSLGSLATESGWNVKSSIGKDATETSVRNAKNPGVLHLATHGFYLNSFTPPAPEGSRGMSVVGVQESAEEKKKNEKGVDPMRASGVALTGAQNTLSSWSQRKAPDPETDGVLTAEEVGALRLDGTWMVVLSACETGVGEARSGEGVFGLRRAFMIAGAENLLMTLWPVADDTTAQIMADFYKEAFATGDAAGSLAKVQRDWLVKLRQERGLLAAIREAGPFAMVTMTAPSVKSFTQAEVSTPESKTPVKSSTSSPDPESEAYKAELKKAKAERDKLQKILNQSKEPAL